MVAKKRLNAKALTVSRATIRKMVHRAFRHFPRLASAALIYLLVGLIFVIVGPAKIHALLEPLGIGGIFIAGMMYAYTLTAGAATIMLPSFSIDYPLEIVVLIGAAGNLFSDLILFRFIREDLKAELARLAHIPSLKKIFGHSWITRSRLFRTVLGFIFIALPLPDEMGIALLATTKIPQDVFRILMFIADVIGVYAVVTIGRMLY
jgi:hypothetical protein